MIEANPPTQPFPAPSVRIAPLADHPQAIAPLAAGFEQEWPRWYGAGGRGDAMHDLIAYANRDELPIGMVAFADGDLAGVAALKQESISSRTNLLPWIGGAYIVPHLRRKGIGTHLIGALCDVAAKLGHSTVYCATSTSVSLLRRAGWQFLESLPHDGEIVHIYRKSLDAQRP